jgi:starch synthase
MKKILFAASEAYPLIKTGGLADVCGSLPRALADLSQDVRLIIPNYHSLKTFSEVHKISSLRINNMDVNLLETRMPDSNVLVWLVDCPAFFNMPGNPYTDAYGHDWANNAERFALFCRFVVEVSMDRAHLDWRPDIVHCNDWQTGLVPALLSIEENAPSTLFTIHNMAFQGVYPAETAKALNLPGQLWNPEGLEFHNNLSFIKGGLVYADWITTVSPSYALEIQTPDFGYGLEGLLQHRKQYLGGIINGIDYHEWDPETDPYLVAHFNAESLQNKQWNKAELQKRLELPVNNSLPMFALIGRLFDQKGVDLVIDCLPVLLENPVQFVLLGTGSKTLEDRLLNIARDYPEKMAVTIGYDESLAHLMEAGADIFLMPSRFEPCGLNQMYSQRYGTLPIVRKTGGLADTVIDASLETIANLTATGFVFTAIDAVDLMEAINRSLQVYPNQDMWRQMQKTAMQKDFTWKSSAEQYLELYHNI